MKSGLRISQDEDRPIEYSVDELASPENKPAEKSSTPTPPSPTPPAIFSRTSASGLMSIEFIVSASGTSSSTRTNSITAESEKANLKPISEPKLVAREPDESGNSAAFSTAPHFIVDGFSAALTDAHWSDNLATQQEQGTESLSEEDSEQNPEEDVERVFAAAEQGDADAQCKLGEMCFYGRGFEPNYDLAVHWYRKAADQGNADAQFALAVMYENGQGIEKNLELAAHWFGKAAEQGDAEAQFKLAIMYENGQGIEKNLELAAHWYGKAAEQGDAEAKFDLGWKYLYGQGVKQDVELAVKWLGAAAYQGDARAQTKLGSMYKKGEDVEQDFVKAVHFITLAADQGEVEDQLELMFMYQEGSKVNKDLEKAAYWEMRVSMNVDGDEIDSGKFDIDEFVQYIPGVLQKYREFEKVKALNLTNFRLNAAGFAGLNQLIRANTVLESLSVCVDTIQDPKDMHFVDEVETLTASLRECNTRLTTLDITIGRWGTAAGHPPVPRQQIEIARLLEQNKTITNLRKSMQSLPVAPSFKLPLDVLMPLVDQMIVESIRGGRTEELTKASLDEFLLIA